MTETDFNPFRSAQTGPDAGSNACNSNAFANAYKDERSIGAVPHRSRAARSLGDTLQNQLEDFQAVLGAILESTTDGILVIREDRKVLTFNQRFLQMWKLEVGQGTVEGLPNSDLISRVLDQLKHPEEFLRKTEALYRTKEKGRDFILLKDGRTIERLHRACRAGSKGLVHIWSFQDVTEKKEMEAQVRLSERMASMGRIASVVVHEINNPMAYLTCALELASQAIRKELRSENTSRIQEALGDLAQRVEGMQKSAAHITRIVRELKAFSRAEPRAEENGLDPVDVAQVLEFALSLVQKEIDHRATLIKIVEPVPSVRAVEGRLSQVFMNLLVNAVQAIEPGNASENQIRIHVHAIEDGKVAVDVSDTGRGIPQDAINRIFDPFFTTKSAEQGTGLGLSICQNIVRSFGGEVKLLEASPSGGTTFRVSLLTCF